MTEDPPEEPRYALQEGPLFLSSVYRHVGSITEWDEIRFNLDMALAQSPMNPLYAMHVVATLWAARIRGLPNLLLLYEVHPEERIVIYEALVHTLD